MIFLFSDTNEITSYSYLVEPKLQTHSIKARIILLYQGQKFDLRSLDNRIAYICSH